MTLSVGDLAPDFELKDQHGQLVKLSSFRGVKNVVITFYPFSFTGTCTGELCAIRDDLGAFQNEKVQLLAVSCDTPYVQKVFAEKEGYQFPVLSDFWPHGAAAKAYGVFNEEKGCALRGSFIVDKEGVIRFALNNQFAARDHEDYKTALASL
ncbi:putative peroxiredoxinc [mine drainage metagenome]|uniref:Putative peroxiredoxinc n=1 Tax=mine drainage metagenome TaxID=410659 RepID=A0A1J5QL73_9ZZZZ